MYNQGVGMNPAPGYGPAQPPHMDGYHAHMAGPHGPAQMAPYPAYHAPHMQPHPIPAYPSHPHYAYGHMPPSQHYAPYQQAIVSSSIPSTHGPPQGQSQPPMDNRQHDTTGQVAPPNLKPKLTGTVWEDEGTICFQVEVNGICVARREDNRFINGTKLLNVANMTRGRRDGILKSEKSRHVVKIGPMHLKGVWIPFERALEFANKEHITEQLYPLFEIGRAHV